MQDMCDYIDCALKNIYKDVVCMNLTLKFGEISLIFALPVGNNSYICIWKLCKSRHRFLHFY